MLDSEVIFNSIFMGAWYQDEAHMTWGEKKLLCIM